MRRASTLWRLQKPQLNEPHLNLPAKRGRFSKKQQAQELLIQYRNTVLWYQLSAEQQQGSNWRSILNALVHKQTGWKPAAVFILQHGLPSVHRTRSVHDVQQHVNRLAVFASAIARWFYTLAQSLAATHDSPAYIRQRSLSDLRDNCDSDSHR